MMDDVLADALKALTPILDQVVIVGGVAHQIHYRMAESAEPALMTEDIDIVLRSKCDTPSVLPALEAAKFEAKLRGSTDPPSMIYQRQNGEYLQFLCHRSGSRGGRDGESPSTVRAFGITAESLANMRILEFEPWTFEVPSLEDEVFKVRVVNPACFILQKGLIHEARDGKSRAKDLLYVHDTLRLFHPTELQKDARSAWKTLSKKQRTRIGRWRTTALGVDSDLVHAAARIANQSTRGGRTTGASLQQTCSAGLSLLIGDLS